MGKYDFDKKIDRSASWSLKWDVREGELPMWVADMDFETAPEIKEALSKRLSEGAFGYSIVPDEWYNAYISWWKKRHHLDIKKEELIFSTGVIPTISSTVRCLPAYRVFFRGRNTIR